LSSEALKKVGVPPPKCISEMFGVNGRRFLYKDHSFKTASMYELSTA
jgi:hypothetical protein